MSLSPNPELAAERFRYLGPLTQGSNLAAAGGGEPAVGGDGSAEYVEPGWALRVPIKEDKKVKKGKKEVKEVKERVMSDARDDDRTVIISRLMDYLIDNIPYHNNTPFTRRFIRGTVPLPSDADTEKRQAFRAEVSNAAANGKDKDKKKNYKQTESHPQKRMSEVGMTRTQHLGVLQNFSLTCRTAKEARSAVWMEKLDVYARFEDVSGMRVDRNLGSDRAKYIRMLRVYPGEGWEDPFLTDRATLPAQFRGFDNTPHGHGRPLLAQSLFSLLPNLGMLDLPYGLVDYPLGHPQMLRHIRIGYGAFLVQNCPTGSTDRRTNEPKWIDGQLREVLMRAKEITLTQPPGLEPTLVRSYSFQPAAAAWESETLRLSFEHQSVWSGSFVSNATMLDAPRMRTLVLDTHSYDPYPEDIPFNLITLLTKRIFGRPLTEHHQFSQPNLQVYHTESQKWLRNMRKRSGVTFTRPEGGPGLREIYVNAAVTLDRMEHEPFFKGFRKEYLKKLNQLEQDVEALGKVYPFLQTFTWSLQASIHQPNHKISWKSDGEANHKIEKGRSGPADFAMIVVWEREKVVEEEVEEPDMKKRKGNNGEEVTAPSVAPVWGEWKVGYSYVSGAGAAGLDSEVAKRVLGALKTDRGWDGFDYVSIDSMM